jgi:hypothetical protein
MLAHTPTVRHCRISVKNGGFELASLGLQAMTRIPVKWASQPFFSHWKSKFQR